MEWRALEAWRAAALQSGSGRVLAERLALVMALVGVLALVTAATVAWQLRPRKPRPALRLGMRDAGPGPAAGGGPGPDAGPGPGPISASGSGERPPSGDPSGGPAAPT